MYLFSSYDDPLTKIVSEIFDLERCMWQLLRWSGCGSSGGSEAVRPGLTPRSGTLFLRFDHETISMFILLVRPIREGSYQIIVKGH